MKPLKLKNATVLEVKIKNSDPDISRVVVYLEQLWF